jgi:hypothetical protein
LKKFEAGVFKDILIMMSITVGDNSPKVYMGGSIFNN